MKRAIEKLVVFPLSNLVATEQVGFGDLVFVDIAPETGELNFSKTSEGRNYFRYAAFASAKPEELPALPAGAGATISETTPAAGR